MSVHKQMDVSFLPKYLRKIQITVSFCFDQFYQQIMKNALL